MASLDDTSPLRVSVVSGTRRVDLLLPSAVPVAELVPVVAGAAGVPDAASSGVTPGLCPLGGAALSPARGLLAQGIEDGAVLVLATPGDERPPAHDDLATVVADVVEHDLGHWTTGAGRLAGTGAGALVLGLAALSLPVLQRPVASAAGVLVSVVLLAAASWAARVVRGGGAAPVLGWLGVAYAVAAGVVLGGPDLPWPVGAGGGAVVAGALALVGLGRERAGLVAAPAAGAVLLAVGLVVTTTPAPEDVVLVTALAATVVAADALPWLAALAAGLRTAPLPAAEPTGPPVGCPAIDREGVAGEVRTAHQLLAGATAATGLLLVAAGPAAVSLGAPGALLGTLCCVLVVLRARRQRVATTGLTGLVSGTAGLLVIAAAGLWLHPGWRPVLVPALMVVGSVVVAVGVVPPRSSLRLGRLAELAETLALVALPPLLLVAVGGLDLVRGWVP